MKNKIIFRADGDSSIGLGHLYRTLALIEMYKEEYECVLVINSGSNIKIIPNSIDNVEIPKNITFDNEVVWLAEKFINDAGVIFLDGYQFDSAYQKKIKQHFKKLVVIDDLGTEYSYADIIINHSPSAASLPYQSESYTQFAMGTEYAVLRPLFLAKAKQESVLRHSGKILVCFGGADLEDLTRKTVSILLRNDNLREINVILGSSYMHDFDLIHPKLTIYRNLSEIQMIELMSNCDRAIVPSSTVLFEVMSVKMPVLTGYYINNQKGIYSGFIDQNAALGLGNFLELSEEEYALRISDFLYLEAEFMIKMQTKLIDGNSKSRFLMLLKE